MSVRAKFKCVEAKHFPTTSPDDSHVQVTFQAVYDNGKANKSWSKWTPSGQIQMNITNPDASDQFAPGEEYWVDFTPVERQSE